jgi:ubiquinone/menaquinone biosynthesis C-methylase UbiE
MRTLVRGWLKAEAILLGSAAALVLLWLLPLKLVSRLAARLGHAMPCPAALAGLLDHPLRRAEVDRVLDRVGIRAGEVVLELGPGAGTFTCGAAQRAGPEGHLHAVDIQPAMIARVEQRVRAAGLDNVSCHVGSAYALPLAHHSVDRAFLVTVLPEIPDRLRALAELRRVLKPGGVLSITEEFYDPDYLFEGETVRLLTSAGYRLLERHGNWWRYTLNASPA